MPHLTRSLRALIGGFDLDPNRIMDVVIGSLQNSYTCSLDTIIARFHLLSRLNLRASLPQILGFSLQNQQYSMSLCHLAAMLLSFGGISIEALLPHLAPSMENFSENTQRHARMIDEELRLFGIVSLSCSGEHQSLHQLAAERLASGWSDVHISHQIGRVIEALLWDRRWFLAQPFISRIERAGSTPIDSDTCIAALCTMAHFTITCLYLKLAASSLQRAWQTRLPGTSPALPPAVCIPSAGQSNSQGHRAVVALPLGYIIYVFYHNR